MAGGNSTTLNGMEVVECWFSRSETRIFLVKWMNFPGQGKLFRSMYGLSGGGAGGYKLWRF